MAINTKKFSLALTVTMGIAYLACAVFVWIFPNLSLTLLGWVAHLVNVDKFAGDVQITLGGVILGLIQISVYAYLASWLFASLYNRFTKNAQ